MRMCFFDMDGTIIDSRADLAATVNHTRRDLGLAERSVDDVLRHVGHGARYLLAHAIDDAPDSSGLLERFMSHYGEHMLESVTLYPEVRRTLEELRSRGWLLGVNTAKPRFATMAILERFGLLELFGGAIIAGGDCSEMKPSALPLVECAALAGHIPSPDDWMVGDNWTDVACGANANVKTAFCAFGFGVLNGCKPTATISSFDELLEFTAG